MCPSVEKVKYHFLKIWLRHYTKKYLRIHDMTSSHRAKHMSSDREHVTCCVVSLFSSKNPSSQMISTVDKRSKAVDEMLQCGQSNDEHWGTDEK